jgi:hypothetical protein
VVVNQYITSVSTNRQEAGSLFLGVRLKAHSRDLAIHLENLKEEEKKLYSH